MKLLDIEAAKEKVFVDINAYLATVRLIVAATPNNLESGIQTLALMRKSSSEELNQIQHEYGALMSIDWLLRRSPEVASADWDWHPRQTGDFSEPDVRASAGNKTIISAEITTSELPQGVIDSRMAKTLAKLATMDGERFYFVLTHKMAQRARTKISKSNFAIEVVNLNDTAPATA
ncbi:hypothetical protein [Hyphomonas oceanitis]|uniref:hypothetical protein n=1 Tax=Hyphomonas oceanitis TaxID=81033 RepID=UPI0030030FA6